MLCLLLVSSAPAELVAHRATRAPSACSPAERPTCPAQVALGVELMDGLRPRFARLAKPAVAMQAEIVCPSCRTSRLISQRSNRV